MRYTYVPGINPAVPVFVSKRERHARRDSAYRLPFVEISKFRSPKRISPRPPAPVSLGLASTESAWHACRGTRARMHADRPSRCDRECAASACLCV